MWTGALWFVLLTVAGLCYPRRPRTAATLFIAMGMLSLAPNLQQTSTSRLNVAVGGFWIALGLWQHVKYRRASVRAKHIEYWTAKV
jgi:hypothetical protein